MMKKISLLVLLINLLDISVALSERSAQLKEFQRNLYKSGNSGSEYGPSSGSYGSGNELGGALKGLNSGYSSGGYQKEQYQSGGYGKGSKYGGDGGYGGHGGQNSHGGQGSYGGHGVHGGSYHKNPYVQCQALAKTTTDKWCTQNCLHVTSFCPKHLCQCYRLG